MSRCIIETSGQIVTLGALNLQRARFPSPTPSMGLASAVNRLRIQQPRKERQYDVCLSFAGEDRPYIEQVATRLSEAGIRVFYDGYENVNLWGKDLYQHLDDVYQNAARYCVIFISRRYAKKLWTNHERKSAQARAFREHSEYILPVRLDQSTVPGIADTVGYVDARGLPAPDLAQLVIDKIGVPVRSFYLPPNPDRLYAALGAKSARVRYLVHLEANAFIAALKRMSEEEKSLVYEVLELGCPGHLPKAIHISLDLLHRSTGYAVAKVLRTLGGMESIGFHCKVEEMAKGDHHRKSQSERIVKLGFTVNTVEFTRLTAKQYSTDIVSTIHDVLREDRCEDCVREAFSRGDSSQLSSATATPERHTASRRRRGRLRATKDAKDRRNKK